MVRKVRPLNKVETKKRITKKVAKEILNEMNFRLSKIEKHGKIYHVYFRGDPSEVKRKISKLTKEFRAFLIVRILRKEIKKIAE